MFDPDSAERAAIPGDARHLFSLSALAPAFDALAAGLALYDAAPEPRCLVHNDRFRQLVAATQPRASLVGLSLRELCAAESYARVRQIMAQVVATGAPVTIEAAPAAADDGSPPEATRWSLIPARDAAGSAAVVLVLTASAARPHAEDVRATSGEARDDQLRRLHVLAEASRVFASAPPTLEAVAPAITQYVARTIGDLCALCLIDSAHGQLLPHHCAHPDPAMEAIATALMQVRYGLDEGPMGEVARLGVPHLEPVVDQQRLRATTKPDYHPYLEQVGVHSRLIVPLRAHGRILGILILTRDRPGRPYTQDDQAMLQDLADRAALAVENAALHHEWQQAEQALRQMNADLEQRVAERTAALIAANAALEAENQERQRVEQMLRRREELLLAVGWIAHVGGWEVDAATLTPSFSDEVYRLHDLPIGSPLDVEISLACYPPEARPTITAAFEAALRDGIPYELELPFVTVAGRQLWVRTQGQPEWQDGRIVRVRGTFQDITARKTAELALAQREQRYRAIWAATNDAMALSDARGIVLETNPAYLALYGYGAEQIIGHSFAVIFAPERRPWAEEQYQLAFWTAPEETRFESEVRRSDGSARIVESRVTFLVEQGQRVAMLSTLRDITERKVMEQALRASESRFRALVDLAPVGICEADADGLVTFVNTTYCAITGLTPEGAQGDHWMSALHPDDRARVADAWERTRTEGAPYAIDIRYQRPDGSVSWTAVEARPLTDLDGRTTGYIGTVLDITDRVEIAALLRAERDRFAQLLQGLSDLRECVIAGEGTRLIYVNDAFCQLSGYSREELLALPSAAELAVPERRSTSEERLRRLADGALIGPFEGGIRHKAGHIVPLEISSRTLTGAGPGQFLSVMRDITERRRAAEALRASEERFRLSVETLMDGFAIFSAVRAADGTIADFRYEYINEAGCRLNQRPYDEHIGRTLLDLLPAHQPRGLIEEYAHVVETATPLAREALQYEDMYGGGRRLARAFDLRAVKLGDGFAVTWRDITARLEAELELRASEARLQASLAEKEVLLKEVHHRVKNNLQIIISLLRLQSQPLSDPALKEQFRDTQNRVRAMALVHEQLYGAPDLTHIPFATYVQQLAMGVLRSYTVAHSQPTLRLEIADDLALAIDTAAPLGLILTELLSNSIKYAFPAQRPGVITIRARQAGETLTLVVQDDGVGLPVQPDPVAPPSLGLQLVQRLVLQLHGHLDRIDQPGTTFRLTLPLTLKEPIP